MKLTFVPKLIIIALFVSICLLGVYFHSERWNSMADGILFVITDYEIFEVERFRILRTVNLVVIPILSLLLLISPFKWTNAAVIVLMCLYCFTILPLNYIEDPTISF
ncbi:hypothetical protein D3C71_767420 [compost metagenome]